MSSSVRITTQVQDFSYGVDSSKVPLIQSQSNPNGLPRNALSWAINCTTRGGGINQRFGNKELCKVHDGNALYQGGILYDNPSGNPYLLLSIGGRMFQVRVDLDNEVIDITGSNVDPADVEKAYWTQGEQFAVKQAGDGQTLPLFWDGTTLRRSDGKQTSLGILSAPFTGNTLGLSNNIALNAPYRGYNNQLVVLTDSLGTEYRFLKIDAFSFYTIQNVSNAFEGSLIPAGTEVKYPDGSLVGKLLASFTVPPITSSINVKIDTDYFGPPLPTAIKINGDDWNITTHNQPPAGVNHIYIVTLDAAAVGKTFNAAAIIYSIPELPPATSMVYYMGRIWYAQNRLYTAGDIVSGPSGTIQYNFKDSILKVTENPLAVGGDGFSVPGSSGNIRALNYPIALDTTLGEGPLFAFTPKAIYSLVVPVTRKDWIAADSNNQPLQRVVQRNNGTVSDRSIVPINGDLFFQSLDPAIRSFFMALRYFGTSWQNPAISNNIIRAVQQQNRGLMHMSSGMEFGERMYQTIMPFRTPVGIASSALAVFDTDPITTLQDQKPPVWDGLHSGLDFLQVFSGNFGGLERAFAVTHSRIDGGIYVWEITSSARFDADDARVEWQFETPAFDWSEYPKENGGGAMEIKEIDGLDLWMDRVFGDVLIKVEFRPDEDQCWYDWATTEICSSRTCAEDINTPFCYPIEPRSDGYRMPISFPKPVNSQCSVGNPRPVTWGGKFQLRFTIKGWARVRGWELHALHKQKTPFYNQICTSDFVVPAPRNIVPPPDEGDLLGNPITGDVFGEGGNAFGTKTQ